MGQPKRGLSRRGLGRAFARLWVILLVACGLYVGFAKAGVFHSPIFVITEGDVADARSATPGIRVLFVGNSFTFYNDMPEMVHELAEENPDGPAIFSVARTRGSWRFEGAVDDKGFDSLLEDVHWDAVVLQEQSQMLSFDEVSWLQASYPYAEELRRKILFAGSHGILFETWGYRDGVDESDSYEEMQGRLFTGVHALAERLRMSVAPVGTAWSVARHGRPALNLWADDGRHPSRAGSYLAACVFYAELTGRDPSESTFTAGLDAPSAQFLQEAANAAVSYGN